MAMQYTRSGAGGFNGESFFKMAREMQGIIKEELKEAGEASEREGQQMIASSGTGRQWTQAFGQSGRTSGGAGRIDSGEMHDRFTFRILGGKNSGLDVGWIKGFEEYFGIQDEGFSSTGFRRPRISGSDTVAGMGVMAHMRGFTRDRTVEAVDRAARRIVDGL